MLNPQDPRTCIPRDDDIFVRLCLALQTREAFTDRSVYEGALFLVFTSLSIYESCDYHMHM